MNIMNSLHYCFTLAYYRSIGEVFSKVRWHLLGHKASDHIDAGIQTQDWLTPKLVAFTGLAFSSFCTNFLESNLAPCWKVSKVIPVIWFNNSILETYLNKAGTFKVKKKKKKSPQRCSFQHCFQKKKNEKQIFYLFKYKTFIFSCLSKIPIINVFGKLQSCMCSKNNTPEYYRVMESTLWKA